MTDTERGLMNAILENPGDDLAREVYADWMTENDRDVECGRCRGSGHDFDSQGEFTVQWCPTCSGSGRVSNGSGLRAEFIRVQVELADTCCSKAFFSTHGGGPYDCRAMGLFSQMCTQCQRREPLRKRERELWKALEKPFTELLPGRKHGVSIVSRIARLTPEERGGAIVYEFSRGFPSRVLCSFEVWCGGECEDYGITDHTTDSCWRCLGTGRESGIGPQVCREWPIEGVGITGREPQGGEFLSIPDWSWVLDPSEDDLIPMEPRQHFLPRFIWDLLEGYMTKPSARVRARRYPTRQAALDALNAAALKWGQAKAKEIQ